MLFVSCVVYRWSQLGSNCVRQANIRNHLVLQPGPTCMDCDVTLLHRSQVLAVLAAGELCNESMHAGPGCLHSMGIVRQSEDGSK